jgi:hypothetical protein
LQRRQNRPLLPEHAQTVRQLEQCRAEREQLRTERDAQHRALRQTREEIEGLPRWARERRRALTDTLTSGEQRLRQTEPTQNSLDAESDRLTRQVAHHTRQRASDLTVPGPLPSGTTELARPAELAWPRPAAPGVRYPFSSALAGPREPYRGPERDPGSGRSR